MTMPEMADELNCALSSIHRWMDKHDIDRDPHPREQPLSISHDHEWGYEMFQAQVNGKNKTFKHHRLLAYRDHDLDELDGMHVHHENRIPWDNRPDNLQLIEPGEHTKLHNKYRRGVERPDKRKVTKEETRELISTYQNSDSTYAELADEYGLSEGYVGELVRNA